MKFKCERYKEKIVKNTLYEIHHDNVIPFIEHHEGEKDDCINVHFILKEGQVGMFAYAYCPGQVKEAKNVDFFFLLVDAGRKKCASWLLDAKITVGGKDVIIHLIKQWQDAHQHKGTLLAYLEEYTETETIGVIAREYQTERIQRMVERIKGELDAEKSALDEMPNSSIKLNRETKLLSKMEEYKLLEKFRDGYVTIAGKEYPVQIYKIETDKEPYCCNMEVSITH